jgi:hypothetical protein
VGDAAGGEADNSSDTVVSSVNNHAFWQTLRTNIGGILGQSSSSDTDTEAGAGTDSANIIFNSESGTIAIRATQRQHKDIAAFLDRVQLSTQR